MSNKVFMYGDQDTMDALNRDVPKILLFGGYLGFNNFGDILQLKEAINFHINVSMLEPVVICHVSSIPDKDFLSRLRNWFGVTSFIFVHDYLVDLASLNMHLIYDVLPIGNLHVYGGGYLNRYWGDYFLKLIEEVIESFKVDNYVLSGQQLDVELLERLKSHFKKYSPKLIGVRDFASLKIINDIGFQCEFSFDDASNIIDSWSRRKPEICKAQQSLFIHLNTSKYTWKNGEEVKNKLRQIAEILKTLAERFKSFDPVFLSTYSDHRPSVRDTLATIISMEDSFPFLDYRVMDLAHMALLHDPFSTTIDSNLAAFEGGVAVTFSYHAAMFCNMLNTPCYLLSDNAYYMQKREGLGENRTLDQFLENPSVPSYFGAMEQREDWLNKLNTFFKNIERSPARSIISLNYTNSDSELTPFRLKDVGSIS